jgi:hypothetical protein
MEINEKKLMEYYRYSDLLDNHQDDYSNRQIVATTDVGIHAFIAQPARYSAEGSGATYRPHRLGLGEKQ